ncbi:MAG: hypothetical protein ACLP8A_06525 [Methylovirgula sp.]
MPGQAPQTATRYDFLHEHSIATYEIIHEGDGWTILHEGKKLDALDTRMAAFDSCVEAARGSIRCGHGVNIKLPHEIPNA